MDKIKITWIKENKMKAKMKRSLDLKKNQNKILKLLKTKRKLAKKKLVKNLNGLGKKLL